MNAVFAIRKIYFREERFQTFCVHFFTQDFHNFRTASSHINWVTQNSASLPPETWLKVKRDSDYHENCYLQNVFEITESEFDIRPPTFELKIRNRNEKELTIVFVLITALLGLLWRENYFKSLTRLYRNGRKNWINSQYRILVYFLERICFSHSVHIFLQYTWNCMPTE